MDNEISRGEFLSRKRDFSPLLVHLTRENEIFSAKDVLDMILDEKTLRAYNHFFIYSPNLKSQNDPLKNNFKVVCFTETPIDQIDILLNKVSGRNFKPDPYGLVFDKKYISEHGGNHVFYTTLKLAKPLWDLYSAQCDKAADEISDEICKLLALVTKCEKNRDFHWEREWRIVGDLKFELTDIYCGLCPEEEIAHFENKYEVMFIDPHWGINKILDKLVDTAKRKPQLEDIPF